MVTSGVVDRVGVVPGCLDRRDELVDVDRLVAANRRPLRREVHRRLDAREVVERSLDAPHARGARHALDVEADLSRIG